jgi:UBX domain-containing protein 1
LSSDWDLETAVTNYYAAQEDATEDAADDSDYMDEDDPQPSHQPQSSHGTGRTLGSGPSNSQPIPVAPLSSSSQPKKKSRAQKKFATLGDVGASGANDDSDDDDKHDLFTGGEKSGLAVQNPDDLKRRILEKAQKIGPPPKDGAAPKKSHFTGSARTLGGDDEPSREIPGAPQPAARAERVERTLHFWQDGFSIDDGDLYRIDDPRNAEILNLIRQGRAPLNIMNVRPGQEVDVEIQQHTEKYVKPKMKYKPFNGAGQRLGSPTPGSTSMPGSFISEPVTPAPATPAAPPTAQIDESQPTVTLRVSLGSGTRLTSRFNTTQTIGDVYDFVQRAEPAGREFVLQTTFPTTELTDKSKVLGEMAEFKRGGAVVQKYL